MVCLSLVVFSFSSMIIAENDTLHTSKNIFCRNSQKENLKYKHEEFLQTLWFVVDTMKEKNFQYYSVQNQAQEVR